MLEKLDSIDWANIHHSHGIATNFPKWIRELLSPDESVWSTACENLREYSNHQDTLYDVTPYVIPFLTEIIQECNTASCPKIIELIGRYAAASAWVVNDKVLIAYERLTRRLTEEGQTRSLEYRIMYKALAEQVNQELLKALPVLLGFMTSQNHEIKCAAFKAVFSFQANHSVTVPALVQALDKDTLPIFEYEASVRRLWETRRNYDGYGNWAEIDFTKEEKRLFASALTKFLDVYDGYRPDLAFIITMFAGEDAPATAIEILVDNLSYDRAYKAIAELRPEKAIQIFSQFLRQTANPADAHDVAFAILEKVFYGYCCEIYNGDNPQIREYGIVCSHLLEDHMENPVKSRGIVYPKADHPLDIATLTEEQQQVLQLVVETDIVWMLHSNLMELYGLPAERNKVRTLLEQSQHE